MHMQRLTRVGSYAALTCAALLPAAVGWQRCVLATLFHVPCPGCGLTRAIALLAAGRVGESLRMNALAVPVVAAGGALLVAALSATYRLGTPFEVHATRFGRAALASAGLAYAAAVVLWVMRWFAWFGGPVRVG